MQAKNNRNRLYSPYRWRHYLVPDAPDGFLIEAGLPCYLGVASDLPVLHKASDVCGQYSANRVRFVSWRIRLACYATFG